MDAARNGVEKVLTAREVLDALSAHAETLRGFGVARLGLIGSTQRGDARPDSDLDFVVDFSVETFDNYMDAKFFLEDLFGRRVDLIMRGAIQPRLRPHLLRDTAYVEGL